MLRPFFNQKKFCRLASIFFFFFFYRSSHFVALALIASLQGYGQTRPWGRLWCGQLCLWAGWIMELAIAWEGCAARAQTAFLKWAAGEEVAAHHKGWQEKADSGLAATPTATSPSGEEKNWSYLLPVCVLLLLFLWYCQMFCTKGFSWNQLHCSTSWNVMLI